MSEHPYQAFLKLIAIDKDILAIQTAIDTLHKEIEQVKAKQLLDQQKHEQLKQQVVVAQKEVDSKELEIQTVAQAEKEKKERLENAADYKQYQSIKTELDHLHKKQVALETALLEAWNILENKQKEYRLATEQMTQAATALQQEIEQKKLGVATSQAELDQKNEARQLQEPKVPLEWREKYSMMRSRVADPVASVHQGCCNACYYKITEQDLLLLRRRAMLQCKSCYRLLYSPEYEFEKETATETVS